MIGSDTLIVKEGGKYRLHVCSIGISLAMSGADQKKGFKEVLETEKEWGNPDVADLKEEEVSPIAHASNCIGPSTPFYHKYAGDGIFLLDLDCKKLLRWNKNMEDRSQGEWQEYVHYSKRKRLKAA